MSSSSDIAEMTLISLTTNLDNKIQYKAFIYLIKASNANTRTISEICSKLTMKTPEEHQLPRSGVSINGFE